MPIVWFPLGAIVLRLLLARLFRFASNCIEFISPRAYPKGQLSADRAGDLAGTHTVLQAPALNWVKPHPLGKRGEAGGKLLNSADLWGSLYRVERG